MILIPAMELMSGKVVSVEHNDPASVNILHDDPVEEARRLQESGAPFFHLIDLDASFDPGAASRENDAILRGLAEKQIPFQVGGGIRTVDRVKELIELGADGILVGTLFYEEPALAKAMVDEFGRRVIALLDVLEGEVRTHRRSKGGGLDVPKAIALLKKSGVSHVIHHRISPGGDATEEGPDLETLKILLAADCFAVHAHCTIRTPEEFGDLLALESEGLAGIVVNTEAGALNIEKALQVI